LQLLDSRSDHKALLWTILLKSPERRSLEIVDRGTCDSLTREWIVSPSCTDSQDFLEKAQLFRNVHGVPLRAVRSNLRSSNNELNDILMGLSEIDTISDVIQNYWTGIWHDVEKDRYSSESKRAYAHMKRVLKYHVFDKRDGAIIDAIIDESGEVITDTQIVNSELLKTLQEIQVIRTGVGAKERNFQSCLGFLRLRWKTLLTVYQVAKRWCLTQ